MSHCFPTHQAPSEKVSTLKGKVFAPIGSIFFQLSSMKHPCGRAVRASDFGSGNLDRRGTKSKISNTKVSDKMPYANSADPDQTAPIGAV